MKLPTILFLVLLALCAVMGLAFLVEETPHGDAAAVSGEVERMPGERETAHPRFPTMDHGGPAAPRPGSILWLGCAFGMLQLTFVVGCLMLGVKRAGRVRSWLAGCGLLLGCIFSMMVVAYQGYLGESTPGLFLSLPAPTAWFLYGYWPAQFLVVVLYVLVFNRAVLGGADLARFHEIVARRRAGDA